MRAPIAAAILLVSMTILAAAQEAPRGSAIVRLDGVDLRDASAFTDAMRLDLSKPGDLTVQLTAPPDRSWDVRAARVVVVAGSVGPASVPAYSRDIPLDASLAPGETTTLQREVDLSALKVVGSGVFRVEVHIVDAGGDAVYGQPFFVRIAGNPFFTVAGATATVLTAASGYGIWKLLRDVRELNEARKRMRRDAAQRRDEHQARTLAARAISAGVGLTGGVEGVVAVVGKLDPKAARIANRRPIGWLFTGLGVGGVALSWAQALGYFPFDLGDLLVGAAAGGAVFLTVGILVAAHFRHGDAGSGRRRSRARPG